MRGAMRESDASQPFTQSSMLEAHDDCKRSHIICAARAHLKEARIYPDIPASWQTQNKARRVTGKNLHRPHAKLPRHSPRKYQSQNQPRISPNPPNIWSKPPENWPSPQRIFWSPTRVRSKRPRICSSPRIYPTTCRTLPTSDEPFPRMVGHPSSGDLEAPWTASGCHREHAHAGSRARATSCAFCGSFEEPRRTATNKLKVRASGDPHACSAASHAEPLLARTAPDRLVPAAPTGRVLAPSPLMPVRFWHPDLGARKHGCRMGRLSYHSAAWPLGNAEGGHV